MAQVLIFGIKDIASLAHLYLTEDSAHDVAAFCVTRPFLPAYPEFEGLPIVPFEDVEREFSPEKFLFFAPMYWHEMNGVRQRVYRQIKEKGYQFVTYLSSRATVLPETSVGENCFILENNTIQPYVTIGDNVILWSGNHIGHHSTISNHVFISSHVVLSGNCSVGDNSFLGVNATIKDNTVIAKGALSQWGQC